MLNKFIMNQNTVSVLLINISSLKRAIILKCIKAIKKLSRLPVRVLLFKYNLISHYLTIVC